MKGSLTIMCYCLQASRDIYFDENSLCISSADPSPMLTLTVYHVDPDHVMFADNAFGNGGDGSLWDTLQIKAYEFRDGTFR